MVANPLLQLTVSPTTTNLLMGDTLEYTITVRNSGTLNLTGVVLSNPLSAGLYVEWVQYGRGSCDIGDDGLAWSLGTVNTNKTYSMTVTATVIGNSTMTNLMYVADNAGAASATAWQVIQIGGAPPEITQQPTNMIVVEGQSAFFSVGSTGGQPLAYQWHLANAGGEIDWAGATNQTLTITNVTRTWAGTWTAIITNAYGAITSPPATLTVLVPVTGQVALEGFVGSTRSVSFTATDGATFTNRFVQTLNFAGGVASYTLSVLLQTTRRSAKTAWNLRQRLVLDLGASPVANFALAGGDINDSNLVDMNDYSALTAAWYQVTPAADIDGNGLVDLDDFFILTSHWHQSGDEE